MESEPEEDTDFEEEMDSRDSRRPVRTRSAQKKFRRPSPKPKRGS
uniref:Uncharacterized protein n=1 Tax=Anguilla anguilla TaxID=7936 RepID=A0A0E9Q6P9_ANGAN